MGNGDLFFDVIILVPLPPDEEYYIVKKLIFSMK